MTFGPDPKPRISTRINRRAPDQQLKKKSKRERERLARLARKKLAREESLRRKKLLRDWLREWPCDDLPIVPAVNKRKRDPMAHHCSEQVTIEVRRVLGRTKKKTKRGSHHGTEEVTSQVGNYLKFRKGDIL